MQMCSQNLKNLLVATLVTSTALLLANMRCPLASDVFSMCQCLDRAVSQSQWFPFSLYTFFFGTLFILLLPMGLLWPIFVF